MIPDLHSKSPRNVPRAGLRGRCLEALDRVSGEVDELQLGESKSLQYLDGRERTGGVAEACGFPVERDASFVDVGVVTQRSLYSQHPALSSSDWEKQLVPIAPLPPDSATLLRPRPHACHDPHQLRITPRPFQSSHTRVRTHTVTTTRAIPCTTPVPIVAPTPVPMAHAGRSSQTARARP